MIFAGFPVAAPLIRKWCLTWQLPVSYGLAICEVESSFRANAHNGLATTQGGAWGLMQITWTTSLDLVKSLEKISFVGTPPHREVIARSFHPLDPTCLYDPELNAMLGTLYLGRFATEFGLDMRKIAVAYHNGGGFLRSFILSGKLFPGELPPKASAYVIAAVVAQKKYESEDISRPLVS